MIRNYTNAELKAMGWRQLIGVNIRNFIVLLWVKMFEGAGLATGALIVLRIAGVL